MLVFCSDEVHICLERREAGVLFQVVFSFPFLKPCWVGVTDETEHLVLTLGIIFSSQGLKLTTT